MASVPSRGVIGLMKRGWHEIPDIVGSSIMALIGVGMGCVGIYNYIQNDLDNRRHMEEFTVIRHDDPRAKYVRKD